MNAVTEDRAKTGKSDIAKLVQETLTKQGFVVALFDPSIPNFDLMMKEKAKSQFKREN